MTEQEWWATAPAQAQFHTWDCQGKTWWARKPVFDKAFNVWVRPERQPERTYIHTYDNIRLPIEIDPTATLRKRPKVIP